MIFPVDFLVIARRGANQLTMAETKQNLIHVFKLAKLLKEEADSASE